MQCSQNDRGCTRLTRLWHLSLSLPTCVFRPQDKWLPPHWSLKESHTACGSNELSTKDSWSATLQAREGQEYQSKRFWWYLTRNPSVPRASFAVARFPHSQRKSENIHNLNAPQTGFRWLGFASKIEISSWRSNQLRINSKYHTSQINPVLIRNA
jgi:hypothetical protein